MPNAQDAPAPIEVSDDHVVVRGGHLNSKRVVALPVRKIGQHNFWLVKSHDEVASLLLTGTPACHRPLCKLTVFASLHTAVKKARESHLNLEQDDAADEANFDFGGEVVEAGDVETPEKKKRRTKATKTAAQLATVVVEMPRYYGQDEPTISLTMLNSLKDVGILSVPSHLQWLAEWVHSERNS